MIGYVTIGTNDLARASKGRALLVRHELKEGALRHRFAINNRSIALARMVVRAFAGCGRRGWT